MRLVLDGGGGGRKEKGLHIWGGTKGSTVTINDSKRRKTLKGEESDAIYALNDRREDPHIMPEETGRKQNLDTHLVRYGEKGVDYWVNREDTYLSGERLQVHISARI